MKPKKHIALLIKHNSDLVNSLQDEFLVFNVLDNIENAFAILTDDVEFLDFLNKVPSKDIILVNNSYDQGEIIKAFNNNVKDYFPSPVDQKLLKEKIKSIKNKME